MRSWTGCCCRWWGSKGSSRLFLQPAAAFQGLRCFMTLSAHRRVRTASKPRQPIESMTVSPNIQLKSCERSKEINGSLNPHATVRKIPNSKRVVINPTLATYNAPREDFNKSTNSRVHGGPLAAEFIFPSIRPYMLSYGFRGLTISSTEAISGPNSADDAIAHNRNDRLDNM